MLRCEEVPNSVGVVEQSLIHVTSMVICRCKDVSWRHVEQGVFTNVRRALLQSANRIVETIDIEGQDVDVQMQCPRKGCRVG